MVPRGGRTRGVDNVASRVWRGQIYPTVRRGVGEIGFHALVDEDRGEVGELAPDPMLCRLEAEDHVSAGLLHDMLDRRVRNDAAVEGNVLGTAGQDGPDADHHLKPSPNNKGDPLVGLDAEAAKPQGQGLSMAGELSIGQLAWGGA